MNNEHPQSNEEPDGDESRLLALFRAIDANAPAPDAELLERLRRQSLEIFAEQANIAPAGTNSSQENTSSLENKTDTLTPALSQKEREQKSSDPPTVADRQSTHLSSQPYASAKLTPSPVAIRPKWSHIRLAWRGLAAVAALAAVLLIGLSVINHSSANAAPPFSEVLDQLRSAKSLQLKVSRGGQSSDVLIRAPGLVRFEDAPDRYRIASGSRLWKIDEAANTVATGDSPWFLNPKQQIDLLGLLELGITDAKPLLVAQPAERVDYAGHSCFVYRADLSAQPSAIYQKTPEVDLRHLQIEAFADAQTNQLRGIIVRPVGVPLNVGPPLAELQLVAMNEPVDESKFVVAKSLTDDGRIGKIVDAQGLVVLRPMLAERWTPISREMRLKTGDWLRTDLRGANAAKIRLSSDVELTAGPGTLIEMISPTQARLHTGELQVNLPKCEEAKPDQATTFELLGPQKEARKFVSAGKSIVRIDRGEKIVEVSQTPIWLAGFEGTTNNESLGSLIVNLPDQPNVPLTIGYHKVNVEIRDQIARTSIEESFVNRTDHQLEGVFYFPLPADASISDFGMWIGNDLVEADIVEKQRAREIYETILREKRDPGLLEWTSGNLFKARVFPINANSEKRIKIVYTQVLPLRGNRYRYTYGLQSDLLRTTPLRELALNVTVNSALPLKSVTCPTHSTRIQETEHSAQVDFAAQEYTPDRDFEVVCEIDGHNSDVVVIPHRRGDDGYFLLQLTPPAREGNWQRDVLPNGKPMNVVLLCDTSASMDETKRKQQAEFVATVLSSLGEKDRFLLAAADVETVWAGTDAKSSPEMMAPTEENIAKVREFLDKRPSLGWTNLSKAFISVLKQAPADAQIFYIGDGIVTAGDADAAAFVERLGRSLGDVKEKSLTIQAVTVGNTYESIVMRGIASVGHGSVRAVSGDQTPQIVAKELLNEIAQPGLRDAKVEFRGLKVAAVYPDPDHLPQIPAGTQQILVGRYLPTEKDDQQGEVIVTGRLGDEPVRYAAKIDLKNDEAGNSFIPRLWARQRLDYLLGQGQSASIKDQIIGLSEQFHIITPFTSLLVLESDADRERFGVKRSFAMRDGERFFAEGRDNANYELRQQQMKRAGDWRLQMRMQVLNELNGLGRNANIFQPQPKANDWRRIAGQRKHNASVDLGGAIQGEWAAELPMGLREMPTASASPLMALSRSDLFEDRSEAEALESFDLSGSNRYLGDVTIAGGMIDHRFADGNVNGFAGGKDSDAYVWTTTRGGGMGGGNRGNGRLTKSLEEYDSPDMANKWDVNGEFSKDSLSLSLAGEMDYKAEMFGADKSDIRAFSDVGFRDTNGPVDAEWGQLGAEPAFDMPMDQGKPMGLAFTESMPAYGPVGGFGGGGGGGGRRSGFGYGFNYNQPNYTGWINTLFPGLPGPGFKPSPSKDPATWSAEAIALSKSLLRTDSLLKLTGGVELRRASDYFDPRWDRRTAHSSELALYSPKAWLSRPINDDGQTLISFCDEKERGVFSLATLLGRTRKSIERDLTTPPFSLGDWSLAPLHQAYGNFTAKVEPAGENRATLILTLKKSTVEYRILVDMARYVVLKFESLNEGKVTGTTTYADFVEIAGTWWAKTSTTVDAKERKTAETKLDVTAIENEKFRLRLSDELAAKPQVAMLHLPFASLAVAKQRVADGSATFEDQITMVLYNCLLQQWEEMFKHLDAAEKMSADKPGVRWLRPIIQITIRRNEEARKWLLDEARKLAAAKQPNDLYLADFIYGQAQSVTTPIELSQFTEILKPVYERQPADLNAMIRWQERKIGSYDALGRRDDAMALRRKLAEQLPWDTGKQTEYARLLLQYGDPKAAYDWLQAQLDRKVERDDSDLETLHTAYADLYRTQARWEDLLAFTTKWIAEKPVSQSAYQQHLSALIYNDRLDDANKLAEQWLKEAQIEGRLAPDQQARLQAAIAFADGNSYNLSFNQMDSRWYEPLSQAAKFFLKYKDHFDIASQLMNDYRLNQVDAGDRLRGFVLSQLQQKVDQIPPDQIGSYIGWAMNGRLELVEPIDGRKQMNANEVPDSIWQPIAEALCKRWVAAKDIDDKNQLSEALRTIYANRFADTQLLPFLRERVAVLTLSNTIDPAAPGYLASYRSALFDALLSHKWSEEIEKEAFQVLLWLGNIEDSQDRRVVQVPALYRLDDAMIANRIAAAQRELHDQGKVNELTRTELMKKNAEIAKAAKTGVAKRLAEEAGTEDKPSPLGPWFRMEQAYLDIQLDQNLPEAGEMCWEILGEVPPVPEKKSTVDPSDQTIEEVLSQARQHFFEAALRQRAFTMAMNLAARKNATAETVKQIMQYLDAGIAQGKEKAGDNAAAPEKAGPSPVTSFWRSMKFRLLIALDRPDELQEQLRQWIREDESTSPWRRALAMLLAERDKLDEAIGIFETLEKDHLLSAPDYRMLSDWYLVTKRHEASENAKIEAYKMMPEQYLGNMFNGLRNRWYQTNVPLPSQLDDNTLLTMRTLLQKSANPENYFWQLRELYAACRDFRLLDMLADVALGRSPQQAYSILQNINGQVLSEVHNEATTDEILGHIKKLREGKLTTTDLRALDLLEALVERRAAEVLNQPGPHVTAGVAALRRAFDRQWSEGEPRMMSSFLRNLGTLPKQEFIDEQLREVRALQATVAAGSRDHLYITNDLCSLLFWSYGKHEAAIEEMQAEVRAYDQAHQGIWPPEGNDVLGNYVHMYEDSHQFIAGENILKQYLAHPANADQTKWLEDRMFALYTSALSVGGEVSLGKDDTLLKNIVAAGLKRLDAAPDENVRQNIVANLSNVFNIGHTRNLPSTNELLSKFAFEIVPNVLKKQQAQYRNTATAPTGAIREALGPVVALRYVVERMEQYPARFVNSWESGWQAFGGDLARFRFEADEGHQNIAELEPRVLKLAIAELKRFLRTGNWNNNNSIFHRNGNPDTRWFWAAKADDFAHAAEEVYAEQKTSGRYAVTIANYFWNGLDRQNRAVEILFVAFHDGVLDENGQNQLVNWLHQQQRWAESIPVLEPLVQNHPDNIGYRSQLIVSYFHSKRPDQMNDLVQKTDAFFHQGGRWTEGNIAELGRACLSSELYEKAVGYLNEAISLHQRNNGQVTLNDAGLSQLYQNLAEAQSALGHTKEAVDAASAALVCWGPQQQQRQDALNRLKTVFAKAKDLPAYIEHLDAEAAKTGQDSPILRKAIGQVLQQRGDYQQAIKQLQIAVDLQPNDKELFQALVACFDALHKQAEGTQQLLRLAILDPHNLANYQQLADRLNDQPAEAERAITSIIEVGATEAENHAALAEYRQKQNRWDEAIDQWTEVAKLRALEPGGLEKLAEAQIHQQQWAAAKATIEKLQRTEWPSRFNNEVNNKLNELRQRLPK